MSLPFSIDESVFGQGLSELAAAKSWDPRVLSALASFDT